MNTIIPINQFKQLLSDRKFAFLIGAIIMTGIVFSMMMVLSIQPKDILVASRFTDFGETHYYRERWYYLYSFAVLGVLMAITHVLIMVKLYALEKRLAAFFIGWMTLFLFIVAFAYAHQVIITAFL